MRSLVTGGAGFIGSHVAQHCLNNGHEVIVLDDLSGGFVENLPPSLQFIQGSVTDHMLIHEIFSTHQIDYVYHLAAYAAEGLSHFIRRFNYNNNLIGSVNLINEAVRHDVECFVFTSSIAVYGAGQLPMDEDQIPCPEDPYGISKHAVELDLKCAHEMFGLDYIIFRPHNVYGENQNIGDPYRNVIGIFMNQLMREQPMTIFGDGLQTRAFSHIDDVAPQISRSVSVPKAYNQVFNIGSKTPCTVREVALAVANAFGVTPEIQYLPQRNEVVHAYSIHEKAHRVLGVGPEIDLDEGIVRMAAWARRNGPRSGSLFSQVEVSKNLPPHWKKWIT